MLVARGKVRILPKGVCMGPEELRIRVLYLLVLQGPDEMYIGT